MQYKDYYKILGVSRDAKPDEIRKAYRKLAKQYHPDVNKEANAEEKYKEINEAYEVLKDPDKRQKYDTLGMNWQSGQDFTPPPGWQHADFGGNTGDFGAGGFSDFFQTLFGGTGRGFDRFGDIFSGHNVHTNVSGGFPHDVTVGLTLSLEDAIKGGVHNLVLDDSIRGKRTISTRLPKGITDGSQIKLAGKADTGGDILINVHIAPHRIFEVDGYDLTRNITVPVWQAVLGQDIEVGTLDGTVTMKMPAGIQEGQKLRLRGKGIPKRDGTNGDLFVRVHVELPKKLTSKQKELWQELAKLG